MDAAVIAQIEQLRQAKTAALRSKYQEVFGEPSRSWNKEFLFRRIAWRLQARAEGDLNERARGRALELADDADRRLRAPKGFSAQGTSNSGGPAVGPASRRDTRWPVPGTVLTRQYSDRRIVVTVLEEGLSTRASYRSAERHRPPSHRHALERAGCLSASRSGVVAEPIRCAMISALFLKQAAGDASSWVTGASRHRRATEIARPARQWLGPQSGPAEAQRWVVVVPSWAPGRAGCGPGLCRRARHYAAVARGSD